MNTPTRTRFQTAVLLWTIGGVVVAVLIGLAVLFQERWLPPTIAYAVTIINASSQQESDHHDDAHESHGSHAGHDDATSLELSPQARRNVGLKTGPVELQTFVRTVSMPGLIIGRPGRSQIEVTATLGGRVTRIFPIEGEAVEPGRPLFELRLTHEELVQAQSELLRSAEQYDVEQREIQRLQTIVDSGAIPGKRLLEREYEQQKIQATMNAQKQSLLLHGLTEPQVESILTDRKLLQTIIVSAPAYPELGSADANTKPFTVRELHVRLGQYVDAGAPLCQLMDYSMLFVEGRAFEQDADDLLTAAREKWEIKAVEENHSDQIEYVKELTIAYIDSEVEPLSRALHFYVRLPNEVVHETVSPEGHRFLTWRYKPGQRMQLAVPVERWDRRIVLPIDAVAKQGVEYYVFQQNGDHFDRTPVQVEHQDQFSVVIANDGSLFPGDMVATNGASQLQMALKNKSGGAVDPHAGHNH